jgi:DUF971 family protein
MTTVRPTALKIVEEDKLQIDWSDGQRLRCSFRQLRDGCPCAECRARADREGPDPPLLPVLSAAETRPLRITAMDPVGNYAYSISFSDGHRTGIYKFELLRELGEDAT